MLKTLDMGTDQLDFLRNPTRYGEEVPISILDLVSHALQQPKDAIFYTLSRDLKEHFPAMALLETQDEAFNVGEFANEGHCSLDSKGDFVSEFTYEFEALEEDTIVSPHNAWQEVTWNNVKFHLFTIGLEGNYCRTVRIYVLGPTEDSVEQFFSTVCKWNSEIRGEVLVFHGQWQKDKRLFQDIATARFDALIFDEEFKFSLVHEFTSFFSSHETYDRYGIAWKRGILLLGPPGNGKTHAIKGLVNLIKKPALYVKSFKHPHQTDHACISAVFSKARSSAPCILVLEDLDSLVDDSNRSFFLNEMDGFAANTGILTVATTNHPERLDPAILERPSRFDRKYSFDLPSFELRRNFLSKQNEALDPDVRLTESEIDQVAEQSEEFSFAYLKELVLSGLMLWIESPQSRRLADLMFTQLDTLKSQMNTFSEEEDVEEEMPFPMGHFPKGMFKFNS